MLNKLNYIESNGRRYPIVFNINVMEEIQEAYGSVSNWGAIVENTGGGEPKVKDLKIGLMAMINEGIDIENEATGSNMPFVNTKQVGRIISEKGFDAITKDIINLTVASTNTGDNEGKNV